MPDPWEPASDLQDTKDGTANDDEITWMNNDDGSQHDENRNPGYHRRFVSNATSGSGSSGAACRICNSLTHFTRMCLDYGGRENDVPSGAGACFNCGEEGHQKRDCPNPSTGKSMGPCFNCGEEGYTKSECTKPRVFKGTCNICKEEGHPASDCPQKIPDICKNCQGSGHIAKDCKVNRKFDLDDVPDRTVEEAWAEMKKASDERDIDDLRDAIKVYSKADPEVTWASIEKRMREENFNVYIIGLQHEVDDVMTLIDLQGQLDREYLVGIFTSPIALRNNLRARWPESPEANLERLENCGLPYNRHVPKCRNCDDMGHIAKHCKQERMEVEKVEIRCGNCEEVGHRVRDCPQPRKSKFACRNCGSEDHEARECPEPRSAESVECRRYNQTGHFAKDCPDAVERPPRTCRNCGSEDHMIRDCGQPRNDSLMTCRNCDKPGHQARECPEPKDWSKVKCNRCGEMGHTVKRCPQPEIPENAGGHEEVYHFEGNSLAADKEDLWGSDTHDAKDEEKDDSDLADHMAKTNW